MSSRAIRVLRSGTLSLGLDLSMTLNLEFKFHANLKRPRLFPHTKHLFLTVSPGLDNPLLFTATNLAQPFTLNPDHRRPVSQEGILI